MHRLDNHPQWQNFHCYRCVLRAYLPANIFLKRSYRQRAVPRGCRGRHLVDFFGNIKLENIASFCLLRH